MDRLPAAGHQTGPTTAPPAPIPPPAPHERAKMVGWYDPGQLAKTGVDVAVSTLFGRHSDYRLLEALAAGSGAAYYDHSSQDGQPLDEIWIDYVSDAGDGFDPTYAVAYSMTQPRLETSGPDGQSVSTPRGSILIFGGDEVYPTATRDRYKQRLVAPYEATLQRAPAAGPTPYAYAIPGNHDWYDSLVAFSRLFCGGRTFAAWQTRQSRSYFALKLPHHWWLLGTDVQLDSDIDAAQVQYFTDCCGAMDPGDNVIICTAEPHWVETAMYGQKDPSINDNNLRFLEARVLEKANVRVFLSGDLHHYRRHAHEDGRQKITAGGGGAFLHPTHGPDVQKIGGPDERDVFVQEAAFPDKRTSQWIAWRNLAFIRYNPWFGVLSGFAYVLLAWSCRTDRMGQFGINQSWPAAKAVIGGVFAQPMWVAALLLGFILFTDTHSKPYRLIAGTIHGLTHIAAAFLLGWAAARVCYVQGWQFWEIPARSVTFGIVFAGGWAVGSTIMGLYLLVSLNGFGRHSNEAFSSLAIPDWKNFLRLHIGRDGGLTIYPYGIERVPRKWREAPHLDAGAPKLLPAGRDGRDWTAPRLIEKPIHIKRVLAKVPIPCQPKS